jgi:hypothetical protein
MDNRNNLWPLLVVLLFGVIGFLVAYRYVTQRHALSEPSLEEVGELAYA